MHLLNLSKMNTIVLDKTGTITEDRMIFKGFTTFMQQDNFDVVYDIPKKSIILALACCFHVDQNADGGLLGDTVQTVFAWRSEFVTRKIQAHSLSLTGFIHVITSRIK